MAATRLIPLHVNKGKQLRRVLVTGQIMRVIRRKQKKANWSPAICVIR